MVRRCTIVVRTGTIGRPLRAIASTRTACTSSVATSAQARAATTSTTVVWRVALAVYSYSVCSFSSGSHEHFKDFANAKYLEVGAKIPTGFPRPPLGPPQRGQGKQICRLCRQVQDFPQLAILLVIFRVSPSHSLHKTLGPVFSTASSGSIILAFCGRKSSGRRLRFLREYVFCYAKYIPFCVIRY